MRLAFALLLVFALCCAVNITDNATTQFTERTTHSDLEIANSWQVLAILAIIISLILVAIAYAVGIGFELNEIQAWAGNELVQVIANALIVGILIVTLAFIEAMVFMVAMQSGIPVPECNLTKSNSSASCLQGVTHFYLNDTIEAAKTSAKDVLRNNMDAAGWTGRRFGIYCTTIYCAQIGVTASFTGQYVLDVDRYSIVFEYYTNLMGFMESQRFFVEQIGFNMGPVILAIGVVARCFFLTRKIGGLLMAIAIGIMFFLPAMYIFDWFTLDLTMNGDKAVESEKKSCPEECMIMPPAGLIVGGVAPNNTIADENEMYNAFNETDQDTPAKLLNGTLETASASVTDSANKAHGKTIKSCSYGDAALCPTACRELPYPASSTCMNVTVQKACAIVPVACKVVRTVREQNDDESSACPQACKVIPPLRNNCDTGNCLNSSYDCRQANTTDPTLAWRPTKPNAEAAIKTECGYASQCPANMTANNSCVYVMPPTGLCSDLCQDCPVDCRLGNVTLADMGDIPEKCMNDSGSFRTSYGRIAENYTVTANISGVGYSASCNQNSSGSRVGGSCGRSDQESTRTTACTKTTREIKIKETANVTIATFTATCPTTPTSFVMVFNNFSNPSMGPNITVSPGHGTYNTSCSYTGSGYEATCNYSTSRYVATCRDNGGNMSVVCRSPSASLILACNNSCPDMCKVSMGELNSLHAQAEGNNSCLSCPAPYLLLHSLLPDEYRTGNCAMDLCPREYRALLPRKACERCLFTEEAYIYDPPVNTQCADLCKPSDATPTKDPGSYKKVGADGMAGRSEITELAKLMIPAYLLPLFNIVATLVFIKGLSQMLGGDIEIPGLMKVF